MANQSSGSNAVGWVVLGFLAGVAATLGVMVFLNSGHAKHTEAESSAAPIAASEAPAVAAQTAPAPAPKPPSAKPPAPAAAVAAANDADAQVQEDAAAAGMTSRRQSSAPPAPN